MELICYRISVTAFILQLWNSYCLHINITPFILQLWNSYCLHINITPLGEYPICEECMQPALPSIPLEVTRNYQLLLQFRDFLSDFLQLYSLYLDITPICL